MPNRERGAGFLNFKGTLILCGGLLAAVACSKQGGPADPKTGEQVKPGTPAVTGDCERYMNQEVIDAWVSSHANDPGRPVLALQGGAPVDCNRVDDSSGAPTRNVSSAYSEVVVLPRVRFGTETAFERDVGGLWRADVSVQVEPVFEEELSLIASELGVGQSPDVRVVRGRAEFTAVFLGATVDVRQQIVGSAAAGEGGQVLRFYVPDALADSFRAELQSFATGAAEVSMYFAPSFSDATIRMGRARAGETVRLAQERVSAATYLDAAWARIESSKAKADREIPYVWMNAARAWYPKMKLAPEEARRDWKGAWRLASGLWARPGDATDELAPELSLGALKFLLLIDPVNSSARWGETLQRLEAWLGAEVGVLYSALMDIVRSKLSLDQEKTVFETAAKLGPLSPSPRAAWRDSIRIHSRAGGERDKILAVLGVADWLKKNGAGESIETAMSWVFDSRLGTTDIARLQSLHEFFVKQGHSKESALARSVDLVVTRRLGRAATEAYRALVEALRMTSWSAQAFEKTEGYLFEARLEPDRALALASTIKWLARTRHANIAIAKAEDYVLVRKLSPSDVTRIRVLWTYMQGTARNLVALDVAEDYVLVKKLSPEQTQVIMFAHEWLVYTPQAAQAWARAEQFAIEFKLTLEQLEQMSEAERWLRRSSVGADKSVERAESYVITRRLSRTETNLVGAAYLWLRKTPAAGVAVEKAEGYVFVRKMTPEKFRQLRESFQKFKAASDPKPLERAEKETFGED